MLRDTLTLNRYIIIIHCFIVIIMLIDVRPFTQSTSYMTEYISLEVYKSIFFLAHVLLHFS